MNFILRKKGYGATLNDQTIHVSDEKKVETSCWLQDFLILTRTNQTGPWRFFHGSSKEAFRYGDWDPRQWISAGLLPVDLMDFLNINFMPGIAQRDF